MPQQTWRTRSERADDVARVHEINDDAFPTSEEAELVDALRVDPAWIDGLSMVAVDADDRPVGFALLTRCHIDDAPALCLAPCAVAVDHGVRLSIEVPEGALMVLGLDGPDIPSGLVRYAAPFGI